MRVLIVSTSMNPDSKSFLLARSFQAGLTDRGMTVELIDLRQSPLPLFDGTGVSSSPHVQRVKDTVFATDAILLTGPIYSWSLAASTKNAAEWIGDGFHRKVVGFAAVAGGSRAYLAPVGLIGSIMLDHESLIVPKVLLVDSAGFDAGGVTSDTGSRVAEFLKLFERTANRNSEGRRLPILSSNS